MVSSIRPLTGIKYSRCQNNPDELIIHDVFDKIARRCKNAKNKSGTAQLFCTQNGEFYSLSANGLKKVKHSFSPCSVNSHKGSCYPNMRNFSNKLCHHLVYEAWIGPRTPGMEIDHINGNKFDYRACNLEKVTPGENRRRAIILRSLRNDGFNIDAFSPYEIKQFFFS